MACPREEREVVLVVAEGQDLFPRDTQFGCVAGDRCPLVGARRGQLDEGHAGGGDVDERRSERVDEIHQVDASDRAVGHEHLPHFVEPSRRRRRRGSTVAVEAHRSDVDELFVPRHAIGEFEAESHITESVRDAGQHGAHDVGIEGQTLFELASVNVHPVPAIRTDELVNPSARAGREVDASKPTSAGRGHEVDARVNRRVDCSHRLRRRLVVAAEQGAVEVGCDQANLHLSGLPARRGQPPQIQCGLAAPTRNLI